MLKSVIVAAAFVATLATSAPAAVVSWTAKLDQAQEVPTPTLVPGAQGLGTGTIDTISRLLTWTITWANLSGPLRGIHFHAPAAPGSTAPVVVDVGAIAGGNIADLSSPTSGSTTISEAGVANLLAGLYYINLHTERNRSGEIRGQVAPVPLPAAAGLLLAGVFSLVGVGIARKRRAHAV